MGELDVATNTVGIYKNNNIKTGNFIEQQYAREIQRILAELRIAETQRRAEKEILDLQSKLTIHQHWQEGSFVVHFNCGGTIVIATIVRGTWISLLTVHANPEVEKRSWVPQLEKLDQLHLKELKTIQPKRACEIVRMLAKRHMLVLEATEKQEASIKKWWQFWK